MKLVLSNNENITQFATLFQNIKVFSESIVIRINDKGLYMQGMDIAQCSLFEAELDKEWFSEYEYCHEDVSTIGINTISLQKVFGTLSEGQTITFDADEDNLELSFTGKDKTLNKFFKIPLMDIEQELITMKNTDSDVDLIISSKKMSNLISQLQLFDDKVKMDFTDEHVTVLSSGIEGSMKVNISFDDVIEYAIAEDCVFCQSYSLSHISMMCIFGKLSNEFVMKFSKERPMEGIYKIGENSHVTFYLAPKINEDDD
tara:strand:- start:3763 stop:4536 length:774 start_codon:yes stop_codon:yes gene_type:complete